MRALTFHGPGDVRCSDVSDPGLQTPGDAIIRVEVGAICGSDLHVWRGTEVGLDTGTILGHEFLGEVVETGSECKSLTVGTRVVAPFSTSCGACFYCERGLTSRCVRGELFGWVEEGRGLQGAQAEYVRVPLADSSLVRVPEDAAPDEALFCGDVLSTGFSCAVSGEVGPGSTVAVIGCGPVGLMAVVAALELGAERVFAIDVIQERLDLARLFGAESIDANAVDPRQVLLDATAGRGADSVLEAVGSPDATRTAFDLARPGGVVSACGVHTEATFTFSPGEAYDKNLTYRAGRSPARHYLERALTIVQGSRYNLAAIISHELTYAEGPRGYEIFDRKLEGCTKVLLRP